MNDSYGRLIAELDQRIDALGSATARVRTARLVYDLDMIRRLAAANGLSAVAPVVHAIEAALGRGERGPHVSSGLTLLRDAVRCGDDARSRAALAAVCGLRVAG